MKHRNRFLKYKLHAVGEGENGGGGNAGGEPSGNAGGNAGNDNNTNDNLISHDTLWDNPTDADENASANNAQQNANSSGGAVSANEQFDNHIASLNFLDGIDPTAVMQQMQNGDVEGFTKALQQIGANAYRNSIVDSNKIVQQRVDKMGNSIKQDVNTSAATGRIVDKMQSELPFTKSPRYAPVAKLVLTQMIDKGASPEKAIAEVGSYFKNLSGEVAKLNPGAPNSRPAGNFNGANAGGNAGNNDEAAPDWIEILGGSAS